MNVENKIRFKIDEKSLFIGEYNDYIKGQTATVNTPINQSKNPKKWRNDILLLQISNCKVQSKLPDMLIRQCLSHSKAGCEITDVFVFDKFLVDGQELNVDCQYIMYIKKETDKMKKLDGVVKDNIHYGRLKLHYPLSFIYKTDGYNIDNRKVLDAIKEKYGGFAYIVRGFEYDQTTKTLNFITSLLGPEGVPLSTIFRRKKGVGKKMMIDPEKVLARDYIYSEVKDIDIEPSNAQYDAINKTRVENGKLGEEKVFSMLKTELKEENELYHTSEDYPQSPYDIEYMLDGRKKYVEVKSTSGSKGIFNLSSGEMKFMEKYKDDYVLYMVTNVKDKFPTIKKYDYNSIMKMKKEIPSIRFYV